MAIIGKICVSSVLTEEVDQLVRKNISDYFQYMYGNIHCHILTFRHEHEAFMIYDNVTSLGSLAPMCVAPFKVEGRWYFTCVGYGLEHMDFDKLDWQLFEVRNKKTLFISEIYEKVLMDIFKAVSHMLMIPNNEVRCSIALNNIEFYKEDGKPTARFTVFNRGLILPSAGALTQTQSDELTKIHNNLKSVMMDINITALRRLVRGREKVDGDERNSIEEHNKAMKIGEGPLKEFSGFYGHLDSREYDIRNISNFSRSIIFWSAPRRQSFMVQLYGAVEHHTPFFTQQMIVDTFGTDYVAKLLSIPPTSKRYKAHLDNRFFKINTVHEEMKDCLRFIRNIYVHPIDRHLSPASQNGEKNEDIFLQQLTGLFPGHVHQLRYISISAAVPLLDNFMPF